MRIDFVSYSGGAGCTSAALMTATWCATRQRTDTPDVAIVTRQPARAAMMLALPFDPPDMLRWTISPGFYLYAGWIDPDELHMRHAEVIVDHGVIPWNGFRDREAFDEWRAGPASGADRTIVVVRGPDYVSATIGAQITAATGWRPRSAIVIHERGRTLNSDDVEAALGVPIEINMQHDPSISRVMDAGLLTSRLPLPHIWGGLVSPILAREAAS